MNGTKKTIFKDPSNQQLLDQEGYVVMDMFDATTIQELKNLSDSYIDQGQAYFYSSSYAADYDWKKEISDRILEIIWKNLEANFDQVKSIGAALLFKANGENSEMPMHQDWTIVDENRFIACNLWIPLVPTTAINGGLQVLPGSHVWNDQVRAPSIPFFLNGHQEELMPHFKQIDTRIGQVVVLNQAVIHRSNENKSGNARPAITAGITSKDADLSLHYWEGAASKQIQRFDQEDDFLLRFNDFHKEIFERPKLGKLSGTFAYNPDFSKELILEKHAIRLPSRKNFLQRLFRV